MTLNDDIKTDFRSVADRITHSLKESGLISDTTAGSIVQTLAETFAFEMSTFYAMLEKAHDSGYLNTAEGMALDNVIAILGIKRAEPGLLGGTVVFSRGVPAQSDIVIPERTKVTGPPLPDIGPIPVFETAELVTIQAGQLYANVTVHEIRKNSPDEACGTLPPGSLTIMPRPILGVENVNNPGPIIKGNKAEDDETLRVRAGSVLKTNQNCTLDALAAIVKSHGIDTVKVMESPDIPGSIQVHIGDPDLGKNKKRIDAVKNALKNAKAAGIHIEFRMIKTIICQPTIVVEIEKEFEDMDDVAFHNLREELKEKAERFINELDPGTSIPEKRLKNSLLINKTIRKIELSMLSYLLEEVEMGIFNVRQKPYNIDTLEKASVDQSRLPVLVFRKPPLEATINLIVSVSGKNEELENCDMDDLKLKVRGSVDAFIESSRLPDSSRSESIKLEHDALSDSILLSFDDNMKLDLESAWIVHQSSGKVVDVKKDRPGELDFEERLYSGNIEVIKKEASD